jgi:carboxypeptidase Q
MLRRLAAVALLFILVLSPSAVFAQQQAQSAAPAASTPGTDPIDRIKDEGMNRSQVMKTLSYLTDVIGPRLTNSPNMKRANEWTRDEMTRWGLQNAHLEPWGPFGRGWTLKRFSAQVTEPQSIPLISFPKAWSPGTNGTITADVVYLNAKDDAELQQFKGKLKGAIVLTSPMREVMARFEAMGTRRDEKDLLSLADAPEPRAGQRRNFQMTPEQRAAMSFGVKKYQFLLEEGAAVAIDPSRIGDGGTIFVQSATVPQPVSTAPSGPNTRGTPPYDKRAPKLTPQLVMAVEHYNRLVRMVEAGEKVKMSVDLAVEFQDNDLMGYNTVAEIPGTDLKDEIVMLGGHMDSWHSGTGATDNGAGVAVGMEAVRIIQALGLKPRRTIRIALWSGEEQGLLGSRAYVAEHFGKMETPPAAAGAGNGNGGTTSTPAAPVLVTKPDYEKLSAYFNLDNGTGKIRGVYLQGNEAVRPLFRQWLMAFRDRPEDKTSWGASTLSITNTGGTDHLAFDAIGLPGFQFIQDEIEYDTRTHHSNQDVFDRIQGDDMKQAATIMAAFVYNAAMLDQKLPRKPMPGR